MSQTKYFTKLDGTARSRFTITGDWPASAMRTIQGKCEANGFKEVSGRQYLKFRLVGLSWGRIALQVLFIVLGIAALAWLAENFMAIMGKNILVGVLLVLAVVVIIKERLYWMKQ